MVTLILPCFNEVQRLNIQAFASIAGQDIRLLFVDDGSTDGTPDFIRKNLSVFPYCRLLELPKNGGKAEAVRQGMLALQKMDWFSQSEWIGYWDSDLATPLFEVAHFLGYARLQMDCEALWGSRVYRLGSHIKRSQLRHYLGRCYATIIHAVLGVEAYDTQCGAKLFRPQLISQAFAEPFLSRWIFDVEILLRLRGRQIVEYPLTFWEDVPGSKVRIFTESFRVLKEIAQIRKKYLSKGR